MNDKQSDFNDTPVGVLTNAHGYYLWHGGGGCMALRKDFPNGDYVLLTQEASVPTSVEGPWEIGFYDHNAMLLLFHEVNTTLEYAFRFAAVCKPYYIVCYTSKDDSDYEIYEELVDAIDLAVRWQTILYESSTTAHVNEVVVYRQYLNLVWLLKGVNWSWWDMWSGSDPRDARCVARFYMYC